MPYLVGIERPELLASVQAPEAEEEEGDERGQPEGAAASNVKPADDKAAETESKVSRNKDGACLSGCCAVNGEHEDGCVEEDGPAGGHETDLGQAGEKGTPGGEDTQWDDGFRWDAELVKSEGDEGDEGAEEDEVLDFAGQAVEEEDDGKGLSLVSVSGFAGCCAHSW